MDPGELIAAAAAKEALRSGLAERLRRRAGLSQVAVASALGVKPATYSRWESGSRSPRHKGAVRLADLLSALQAVVLLDDEPADTGSRATSSAGEGGGYAKATPASER
jgi:transcriptional regulator with XRE-family HTH domain